MPELIVAAIVFDMDGVLIDSGSVYARHWERWAASRDIDYKTVAAVHPGRPPQDTIRLVAPHLDAANEAAGFNESFLTRDSGPGEVSALPGARELLLELPPDRWNVATSALGSIAREWLAIVGLPVPAALVSVEDVARGKPAPDAYLLAADRLGFDASRCLVIEDAPAGVAAAKAAGATVLAVLTTHDPADLVEADARVAGLPAISLALVGSGLRVSWESTASDST